MNFEDIGIWGIIMLIVQIYCAYHAFKRKRYFWAIISLFLVFTAIFYIFLYIIPERRSGSSSFQVKVQDPTKKDFFAQLNPGKKLEQLEELVKESDTVDNKIRLADQYMNMQKYDKAYEYYTSCIKGIFKDDYYLLLDASKAAYAMGEYDKSLDHLAVIEKSHPDSALFEHQLMKAKNLLAVDKKEESFDILKNIYLRTKGEEAKFLFAQLLCEKGNSEEGIILAQEIVKDIKNASDVYRKEQTIWEEEALKLINKYSKK